MNRSVILAALLIAGAAPCWAEPAAAEDPSAGFARAPIRLDAEQRQAIGLTYGAVERRSIEKVIRTVGRFDYDERKLAEVTLKVGGYIQDLFVDYTGKPVRKGDALFSIYSPDLVSAQQEYLLAIQTRDRLKGSRVSGALESADSLVRASRERLRLWDLTDRQVHELEESGKPKLYQTIHSPISGVVIEKMAFKGQAVQPGATLYKIADLSTVWVYADVYEYELPFVRVGQEAKISLSYSPDRTFTARVTYIYPTLDPKTRTVKVRFDLENSPDQILRPEMYGKVELHVPLGERLVVPATAVIDSGRRQVVFVGSGDGQLTPREVRLGDRLDPYLEVKEGLSAGERVVTSANFLIDSESKLKSAESMMGMMGAIGMGDWKMESAKPMTMGGAPEPAVEEKRAGDLRVAVFPAQPTVHVGENKIRVQVRDASGMPVAQATVRFSYTMDMPGMGIEESATQTVGEGLYEGTAKFSMSGPWGLVVQIDRPGQPPLREKFTIRVAG